MKVLLVVFVVLVVLVELDTWVAVQVVGRGLGLGTGILGDRAERCCRCKG